MIEIIPNLHPIVVHFTVALFSLSTGLFVALLLFKRHLSDSLVQQLTIVARWNLWFGAAITLVTVAAGFYAYNTVAHDTPSHEAMTEHKNWALVTASSFILLALFSALRLRAGKTLGKFFVGLLLGAQLLLLSTAWHGGEVVYRYGLGVMSLPQSTGGGHNHSHGGDAHEAHSHGDGSETKENPPHRHGEDDAHGAENNGDSRENMDFSGMNDF